MATKPSSEHMQPIPVPSRQELLENARRLVPILAERADQTEQNRAVLDETLADFHAAGLFRILQPPHLGGFGLDVTTHLKVAAELARGCASSAWIQTLRGFQNMLVGFYDPKAQDEVLAASEPLSTVLVIGPSVTADNAEGGYSLSGRWPYVSGVDDCNWLLLSVHDPEAKKKGRTRVLTCLVPRKSVTIIDDWFVLGLRGTGSKSVTLDNEFVPDHRVLCLAETIGRGTPGQVVNPGPLFRGIPASTLFTMTITAPALGLAECALEAFEERLSRRQNPRMLSKQSEWTTSQIRVGQSVARLETAKEKFFSNVETYAAQIENGENITVEQRVHYRMNMVEVVRICADIVHELFQDAGTGALFDGTTLQRVFRDMYTLRSHFALRPESAAENAGRAHLGLDVDSLVV